LRLRYPGPRSAARGLEIASKKAGIVSTHTFS
jgi:hypothetical protein